MTNKNYDKSKFRFLPHLFQSPSKISWCDSHVLRPKYKQTLYVIGRQGDQSQQGKSKQMRERAGSACRLLSSGRGMAFMTIFSETSSSLIISHAFSHSLFFIYPNNVVSLAHLAALTTNSAFFLFSARSLRGIIKWRSTSIILALADGEGTKFSLSQCTNFHGMYRCVRVCGEVFVNIFGAWDYLRVKWPRWMKTNPLRT